ncbi:MAG: MATE family efflux transporter [Lachnospiraceae bacterium]|nr:MATE family efflux transporter [Lachnospiraceae bacterium]
MKGKSFFKVDFLHGPIIKSVIIFAIPLLISSIFQQLYNMVDTMIIGHYLGDDSLAAMGACSSIYSLLVGFALGIGSGMSIVNARSFGAGDLDKLKRSVASSICIGLCVALTATLLGRFALRPLLEILNTPENIIDEAYAYVSTIVSGVIVTLSYNLCSGMLRAIGNSFMPLVFLIISSILNVCLDLLFIVQFSMGVRGAAIATVMSQGVSAVLCATYIIRKTPILVPKKEHFKFDAELWKELLAQGISMALMGSIVSIGTVILQYGINGFGSLIIVAHMAARKIYSLFCLLINTTSMAVSTFVSQNKGAGNRERIVKVMKYAYIYDVIVAGLITVALWAFGEQLIIWLTGTDNPVVLENGVLYLRIIGPFLAILGMLLQTRSALQGIGEKFLPIMSSVIEMVGKILFSIFIIPKFGYFAVIICEPVIWCVMVVELLASFWRNGFIRGKKAA